MKEPKEKAFNNWTYNAIHLTFPNGNSISTTWASFTYSDNNDSDFTISEVTQPKDVMNEYNRFRQSDTVEIMILKAPNELRRYIEKKYDFESTVKGYLSIKEWLEIVNLLASPTSSAKEIEK